MSTRWNYLMMMRVPRRLFKKLLDYEYYIMFCHFHFSALTRHQSVAQQAVHSWLRRYTSFALSQSWNVGDWTLAYLLDDRIWLRYSNSMKTRDLYI